MCAFSVDAARGWAVTASAIRVFFLVVAIAAIAVFVFLLASPALDGVG
jgi:hypothetical protein